MTTYYKAVRPDGADFYTGTVRWIPEDGVIPAEGWLVIHPTATTIGPKADEYLSVSTVPTECTGMQWPCRLLAVEAVGDVSTPNLRQHNKRAAVAWLVRGELSAHEALGPQGAEVAAILDRMTRLTPSEAHVLSAASHTAKEAARGAAWDTALGAAAARGAAWDIARGAAWEAVRVAAWGAALKAAGYDTAGYDTAWYDATWYDTSWYDAAGYGALATLTRDLIDPEIYDLLIRPWRDTMGEPA